MKWKQKLCDFHKDKNSNKSKVLTGEFHKKLLKVIHLKTRSIRES